MLLLKFSNCLYIIAESFLKSGTTSLYKDKFRPYVVEHKVFAGDHLESLGVDARLLQLGVHFALLLLIRVLQLFELVLHFVLESLKLGFFLDGQLLVLQLELLDVNVLT